MSLVEDPTVKIASLTCPGSGNAASSHGAAAFAAEKAALTDAVAEGVSGSHPTLRSGSVRVHHDVDSPGDFKPAN